MGETGTRIELRRTYIQTLSAISRSGGYRLGKQLELVVPLVLQQCSTSKSGGDNEMGEACLQAFESFVLNDVSRGGKKHRTIHKLPVNECYKSGTQGLFRWRIMQREGPKNL